MHLGNHNFDQVYFMKTDYERIPIEQVNSEKDLGVIIDSSLKYSKNINSKIRIANRNLWIVFRTFTNLDKEICMNLFKSLVRPHLKYASSVWSPIYKKGRPGCWWSKTWKIGRGTKKIEFFIYKNMF